MNNEERIIKASACAGFTELLIGLIMALTGAHQWYFDHFHFFGVLGMGMLVYAYWHGYYFKKETGKDLWTMKKK